MSVIILWVFVGVMANGNIGGWTTYQSYPSLESCKESERRLWERRKTDRAPLPVVHSICLPAGVEPK